MSGRESVILFNARPHPGPLPRGEGESSAAAGPIWSRRLLDARPRKQRRLFAIPSPGGEGQGEGER
jgi:hypothetical protein